MRDLINLTDEQIEEIFDEETGYNVYVPNIVFTRETIEDFKNARKDYSDRGTLTKDERGILVIEKAQTHKGKPRKNMLIIDFGDFRGLYLN